MKHTHDQDKSVRLHLTNIVGLGAVRLLQSLLPSLVGKNDCKLDKVYLPIGNESLDFSLFDDETTITYYKRYLPNAISRFLECTLLGYKFSGTTPLLVFGDIPIKCNSKQTVFVQNTLLIRGVKTGRRLGTIKYLIARWIFMRNLQYVNNFIVQTDEMKASLIKSYPNVIGRVHVVSQPVPSWLIESKIKRTNFQSGSNKGLRLFYPAALYPHKNHQLLNEIDIKSNWPISELILTIPENENPKQSISWIHCVDKLEHDVVLNEYRVADALLFLSLTESYGFPLVEAMWLGLPIICPDLPYARTLCGEQAIYFDPHSVMSLHAAIVELNKRRSSGWWPDWKDQLSVIPKNWDVVAEKMIEIICDCKPGSISES